MMETTELSAPVREADHSQETANENPFDALPPRWVQAASPAWPHLVFWVLLSILEIWQFVDIARVRDGQRLFLVFYAECLIILPLLACLTHLSAMQLFNRLYHGPVPEHLLATQVTPTGTFDFLTETSLAHARKYSRWNMRLVVIPGIILIPLWNASSGPTLELVYFPLVMIPYCIILRFLTVRAFLPPVLNGTLTIHFDALAKQSGRGFGLVFFVVFAIWAVLVLPSTGNGILLVVALTIALFAHWTNSETGIKATGVRNLEFVLEASVDQPSETSVERTLRG